MAIIGIDLGTTNSLVSVYRDGKPVLIPNSFNSFLTPSVVSVDEDGTVWVGAVAREKRLIQPERSISSFKRQMGTDQQFSLGKRNYTPQELSALVLRKLKEDAEIFLGETVEEALISVPAYFNDEQRWATKEAGRLAGLKTERLINEPSSAALACRNQNDENDSRFLVVDFGGGTLDVSVVECFEQIIEIQAVAGDNHLGGDDFDLRIAEYFCAEHKFPFVSLDKRQQALLLKRAEQCKQQLTEGTAAMLEFSDGGNNLGMFITRPMLVEISAVLFTRLKEVVMHALRDAGITMKEIDRIVLAGGTCKMPVVRQYIAQTFGKEPVFAIEPDEIVAMGAGIYAGMKERCEEIRDIVLTDICPFTLGVGTVDSNNEKDLLMSPVIERNSVLPVSKIGYYVTVYDNETRLRMNVFQGESLRCSQNLELGWLDIEVPPAPRGAEGVRVRFTYDINGILQVDAENSRGESVSRVFLNKRVHMSEEELERRMLELEHIKQNPREEEKNQLIFAKAERLYSECLGADRATITALIRWYSEIMRGDSPAALQAARSKANETLDYIEKKLGQPEES